MHAAAKSIASRIFPEPLTPTEVSPENRPPVSTTRAVKFSGDNRSRAKAVGQFPILTIHVDCAIVWLALLGGERLHQLVTGRHEPYSRFIRSTKDWNQVLFHLAE